MFGRKKVAAVVAEFLGTATLAFVVLNVSRSAIGLPYFVAFAGGLAIVLMGLSVATDVHLNPALTLGLWTARRVKTLQAVVYIAAQMLGGWAAYGLYKYFVHGTVQRASSHYEARIMVAEAVGTFVFALVASAVLYRRVWGWTRAAVVGGAYALGVIVASASSAGFINPAVAMGSNAWGWGTYVLGPVLGAIIGVNLYGLLFAGPESEKAKVAVAAAAPAKEATASTSAKAKTAKPKAKAKK